MSIERTSGQVWSDILRESLSLEIVPPIRVKPWGKIGLNAPYSMVVRQDILRDFLREGAKLRPDQIYRTQLHILGERPHKIPRNQIELIFPKDERNTRHHAWIEVDKGTETHVITIAAFRIWDDFSRDRKLFLSWGARKRKSDEAWQRLGKKTRFLEANAQRRQLIEDTPAERLETVLDEHIALVGMEHVLQLAFHEVDHSFRYRNRYSEWPIKEKLSRMISNMIEPDAEEAEEKHLKTGRWNEMLQFIVNKKAT